MEQINRLKNIKLKIPAPEGFKFNGEYCSPLLGEYVLNAKTNKAIRMCAGMPVLEGFILEPINKLPDKFHGKKVIEVSSYPYKHFDMIGFIYKGTRWKLHEAVSIEGFFGYLYRVRNTDLGTYETCLSPARGINGCVGAPVAVLFGKGGQYV